MPPQVLGRSSDVSQERARPVVMHLEIGASPSGVARVVLRGAALGRRPRAPPGSAATAAARTAGSRAPDSREPRRSSPAVSRVPTAATAASADCTASHLACDVSRRTSRHATRGGVRACVRADRRSRRRPIDGARTKPGRSVAEAAEADAADGPHCRWGSSHSLRDDERLGCRCRADGCGRIGGYE